MAARRSDEGADPCAGGTPQLLVKREHTDRLRADRDAWREAVLGLFREALSCPRDSNGPHHAAPDASLPDRSPRRGGRSPAGVDPRADRG